MLVAGGGIGGLVTTLAMQNAGLEVKCYGRGRAYKPWGGPIQMAGNAMAALELCDPTVTASVVRDGTVTGDRLNGLLDGNDGDWFVRFCAPRGNGASRLRAAWFWAGGATARSG